MKIETLNLEYGSFQGVIFFERDFGTYIEIYAADDERQIYCRCKDEHEDEESKFEPIDILSNNHLITSDLYEFKEGFEEGMRQFDY